MRNIRLAYKGALSVMAILLAGCSEAPRIVNVEPHPELAEAVDVVSNSREWGLRCRFPVTVTYSDGHTSTEYVRYTAPQARYCK